MFRIGERRDWRRKSSVFVGEVVGERMRWGGNPPLFGRLAASSVGYLI